MHTYECKSTYGDYNGFVLCLESFLSFYLFMFYNMLFSQLLSNNILYIMY